MLPLTPWTHVLSFPPVPSAGTLVRRGAARKVHEKIGLPRVSNTRAPRARASTAPAHPPGGRALLLHSRSRALGRCAPVARGGRGAAGLVTAVLFGGKPLPPFLQAGKLTGCGCSQGPGAGPS